MNSIDKNTYECEFCGNEHPSEQEECPFNLGCYLDGDLRARSTAQGLTSRFELSDFETGMYGLDQEVWDCLRLGLDYVKVEYGDLFALNAIGYGHLKAGEEVSVAMPGDLWTFYSGLSDQGGRERILTNEGYDDCQADLPDPMWFSKEGQARHFPDVPANRNVYLTWHDGSVFAMWREIEGPDDEEDVRNPDYDPQALISTHWTDGDYDQTSGETIRFVHWHSNHMQHCIISGAAGTYMAREFGEYVNPAWAKTGYTRADAKYFIENVEQQDNEYTERWISVLDNCVLVEKDGSEWRLEIGEGGGDLFVVSMDEEEFWFEVPIPVTLKYRVKSRSKEGALELLMSQEGEGPDIECMETMYGAIDWRHTLIKEIDNENG